MSVINTNVLALTSQNNPSKSQNALGTAIERLSSGLRINSAKDDAAGQEIANRFTANIKGLTQATRNANDGISIAQTTEGALNEVNNNLQRVRELTVQAANGSNSPTDLKSIQDEITQRLEEIDRISRETQFNGVSVLGDTADKLRIQVGANDNQTIDIGLRQVNAETLKLNQFDVTVAYGSDLTKTSTVDRTVVAADFQDYSGDGTISLVRDDGDNYLASVSGSTDSTDGLYAVTIDFDSGEITVTGAGTATGNTQEVATLPVNADLSGLTPGAGATGGTIGGLFQNDDGDHFVLVTGTPEGDGYYAASVAAATGAIIKRIWLM